METIPALLIVGASYAGYLLAWRRVRVARGRTRGPALGTIARYDHLALASELAPVLAADDTKATGERIVPVPGGMLGTLPPLWTGAPWSFAVPSRLGTARDELLLGLPAAAADHAAAENAPPEAIRSLFTWAFLHRLFGGELAGAAEIAGALAAADAGAASLSFRLFARLEAVRAELGSGADREAAIAAGRRYLQRGRIAGIDAPPAEAGLAAHFEILRLSFWDLEWREYLVRRVLRSALAKDPQAPVLHLVRAHLAAVLGDGPGATDHLARALYYSRGAAFYARPIAESPFVSRLRPALAAEARELLPGAGGGAGKPT